MFPPLSWQHPALYRIVTSGAVMLNGALEFGRKTILGRKTTPLGAVNVVPARDGVQGRGVSHGGHASAREPDRHGASRTRQSLRLARPLWILRHHE